MISVYFFLKANNGLQLYVDFSSNSSLHESRSDQKFREEIQVHIEQANHASTEKKIKIAMLTGYRDFTKKKGKSWKEYYDRFRPSTILHIIRSFSITYKIEDFQICIPGSH